MVVVLDGETLTIDTLVQAAYDASVRIELSAEARARVDRARGVVDRWIAKGRVVYGTSSSRMQQGWVRCYHQRSFVQ